MFVEIKNLRTRGKVVGPLWGSVTFLLAHKETFWQKNVAASVREKSYAWAGSDGETDSGIFALLQN
jgi:hypothetical protein